MTARRFVCHFSGEQQRKDQTSALLILWEMSPNKGPLIRKAFPFHNDIKGGLREVAAPLDEVMVNHANHCLNVSDLW